MCPGYLTHRAGTTAACQRRSCKHSQHTWQMRVLNSHSMRNSHSICLCVWSRAMHAKHGMCACSLAVHSSALPCINTFVSSCRVRTCQHSTADFLCQTPSPTCCICCTTLSFAALSRRHDVYYALTGKGINGSCMMSPAAVPMLPSLLERGIQPSWAVEKHGLMIMTTTNPDMRTGLWAPFAAFRWPVWVCLILTSLFVPLVLWVFEMVAAYLRLPSKKEQQLAQRLLDAQSAAEAAGQGAKGGNKDVGDVEAAEVLAAGMVSMRGGEAAAAADAKAAGPQAPKMFSEDWYMLHFRTNKADALDMLRK